MYTMITQFLYMTRITVCLNERHVYNDHAIFIYLKNDCLLALISHEQTACVHALLCLLVSERYDGIHKTGTRVLLIRFPYRSIDRGWAIYVPFEFVVCAYDKMCQRNFWYNF